MSGLFFAALVLLEPPLGPSAEGAARRAVEPYALGAPVRGEVLLWSIRVDAESVRYGLGPAGGPADAFVVLEAGGPAGAVRMSGDPGTAREAAEAFATHLRARIAAGDVAIRAPAPREPGAARPAPVPAPPSEPEWPAWALLAALLASIAAAAPRLARALPPAPRSTRALAWGFGVLALAVLVLLPDVVSHPHGHGFDAARAVAGGAGEKALFRDLNPYGALAAVWPRVLGAGDAFAASRAGAALSVPLLFGFALALGLTPAAALLAAGLLLASPAFLYMGRAEAASAPGLALLLAACLLASLAGRTRDPRLLVPAALGLATLASYRLLGPVAAGPVGLLVLAGPKPSRRWLLLAAAAGAAALLLALPHLLHVLALSGDDVRATRAGGLPETLLGSPRWSAPGFAWVALAGGVFALRRRPVAAISLGALAAGVLLVPGDAAGPWPAQPRYGLWALVPAVLGVAVLAEAAWSRLGTAAVAVPPALALGLSWGLSLPARSLALEHPEDTQLRAWRDAEELLPEGATLAVPRTPLAQARASLPDYEMRRRRPDAHLAGLEGAKPGGLWFRPLYCEARYEGAPVDASSECALAERRLRLRPFHVRGAETALPADMAPDRGPGEPEVPLSLLAYPEPVAKVGLYRILEVAE